MVEPLQLNDGCGIDCMARRGLTLRIQQANRGWIGALGTLVISLTPGIPLIPGILLIPLTPLTPGIPLIPGILKGQAFAGEPKLEGGPGNSASGLGLRLAGFPA